MSRTGRSGLPSGPGPRSRSAVRNRYDDDYDARSDSPSQFRRQVRPQKSMNSVRSASQQRAPPMPSRPRHVPTQSFDTRDSNRSSDSTQSSSTSSFLDRMRGYASSRTSIEDDDPLPKSSTRSMRTQPSRAETPPQDDDAPEEGEGFTLWSKVASAASTLTVNVGKAWSQNVATFAGEETPPGQESRLTRAMKAYHLEKARDPSDLPAWLFDEKERRHAAPEQSRSSRRRNDDYDYGADEPRRPRAEPPPSRGLRDIYDAAAATPAAAYDRSGRGARSYGDDTPQPSRATDRLKALRDAKRSAVNPNVVRDEERADVRGKEPLREAEPRRRVGLPSGPVSRRF
ncbi:hypothetical protein MKEN_01198900 [Mycena kentingensis (nom. inval.)]|nr:hypothetical protein MKEN_01198900 [Mycena kentingensis (nom. inval.)]